MKLTGKFFNTLTISFAACMGDFKCSSISEHITHSYESSENGKPVTSAYTTLNLSISVLVDFRKSIILVSISVLVI